MNKYMRQKIILLALIVTLSSVSAASASAVDSGESRGGSEILQAASPSGPPAAVSPYDGPYDGLMKQAERSAPVMAAALSSDDDAASLEGDAADFAPTESGSKENDSAGNEPTDHASVESGPAEAASDAAAEDKTEADGPPVSPAPAADESSGGEAGPAVVGVVDIGGGNSIEVRELAMLPGDEGNIVTFTLNVVNASDAELQFIDYWVRLMGPAGEQFTVTIMPQDKEKNAIPPGMSQEIHFYAKVRTSIALNDLQFKIIRWDFTQSDFERTLGVVSVPADYTNITPANGTKVVTVSGVPLKTAVAKVTMNRDDKYLLPMITFNLENIGAKSVAVPAWQFFLRTEEGLMYPLNVEGLSKDAAIYPKFEEEVRLSGSLPEDISLENWELLLTLRDETARLTLPVASYRLPDPVFEEEGTVAVGQVKSIEVDDNTLETSILKRTSSKNDKFIDHTITFVMKNTGTTSVKVPKYRFSVKTADGLTYPATAENFDNVTVDPQVSKEIEIHVSIPAEVNIDSAVLVLSSPLPEGQDQTGKSLPMASYALPSEYDNRAALGDTVRVSMKVGAYDVRLNSIQRLPWQDKDLLSLNVSLINRDTDTLPIPNLAGKIVLDGSVEVPVTAVPIDRVIGVPRDGEVRIALYGTIPYTYEYSRLQLVLQERVDDKTAKTLVEFEHGAGTLEPPTIRYGSTHEIQAIGRSASLAVRSVRTYEGLDGDLVTVLVNTQNLEKRLADAPSLVAHFVTPDGATYPAAIQQLKNKLSPNSVATLFISATLPSDTETEDLRLLIGEAVGSGSGQPGDTEQPGSSAYVNAVAFELPEEDEQPRQSFTDLDFYPYRLTMNNFRTEVITQNQFRFAFDYELSRSPLAQANMDDRKILLEFKDSRGDVAFSQELQLGKEDGLKLGSDTKEFVKNDPLIISKIPYLQNYDVYVYDEFQGMKKLIAVRSFTWFVYSD